MRVASIWGMRPSTNMLRLGPLLKPKVLTMGKPKASMLNTNLGRVLQLKPKSISTMGKPKASIPLTAHLFEMTWLSINMLGLGFFSSPISVTMGKPKTSSPSQLASPPGYHPQRKLPPSAAPWREEQWRQSSSIQKMLPPWWLVKAPAWSERVMVSHVLNR